MSAATPGASSAGPIGGDDAWKRRADRLRRIEWAVALLATGVAVLLHLVFFFHAGALWRDEINSVNTAPAPSLSEMWRLTEFESAPLLWLLLLRGWFAVGAGSTDGGLRLFGLVCGLALPAAVWFAARRLRRAVPLVSLALLVVNAEVVRWGATVRAWGLGASLAIVAFVLVWDAAVLPTRRRVLLAGLAAVLSVQCLYQNTVFLAAVVAGGVAAAIARREWRQALVPIGIGAAAAVSLVPYAGIVLRRAQWNVVLHVPLTVHEVTEDVWQVLAASGTIVFVCWLAVVVIALALAVRAVAPSDLSARSGGADLTIYAAVVLVIAMGGLAAFYLRLGYPTEPWHYIGVVALVAVCAEAVIAPSARAPAARVAFLVLALVVLVVGLPPAWASLQERQTNLDEVAARLGAKARRGDLVVVHPWFDALTLDRYYRGDAEVTTIPPLEDRKVHRYDLLQREMLLADPLGPLLSRIRQALASGHRVWLVGDDYIAVPPAMGVPKLPPPPLPETGWNAVPYTRSWSLETGAFLWGHAVEGRAVHVGSVGGRFESVSDLVVVRGWRP